VAEARVRSPPEITAGIRNSWELGGRGRAEELREENTSISPTAAATIPVCAVRFRNALLVIMRNETARMYEKCSE